MWLKLLLDLTHLDVLLEPVHNFIMSNKEENTHIEFILKHDPFQAPTGVIETETCYISQLEWLVPDEEKKMSPRAKALLEYWKDVGVKLIAELNNGEERI